MNSQQSLKIPMSTNYLPQTKRVTELINLVLRSFNYIENREIKNEILCTLSAFSFERTVTSLSLLDLMNKARDNDIDISINEACKILAVAVADIEQNYASKVLDYHLDAFMEESGKSKPGNSSPLPSPSFIKASLLSTQPENIEPVEFTHFDCWFDTDSDGEYIGELYQWGDSGADMLCRALLDTFSDLLGKDLIQISTNLKNGEYQNQHDFFLAVANELIQGDYFCYLSDTCFEVYDGASLRAEYNSEAVLEMVAA